MPVVGPVDMWMNFRFETLGALALASPAILQRVDGGSDNAHSILPYLSRAGIVDAHLAPVPARARSNPVLAWTVRGERDGLAMALSMLGLRVRAFDGNEPPIHDADLPGLLDAFDALVDAPLANDALSAAIGRPDIRFVLEGRAPARQGVAADRPPPASTVILPPFGSGAGRWGPICALLGVEPPPQDFPVGPPRCWRVFRDDRMTTEPTASARPRRQPPADESPWAMLPGSDWPSPAPPERSDLGRGESLVQAPMTAATPLFPSRVETFPGNLATFERDGLVYGAEGARLVLSVAEAGNRPYRSGAFASPRPHGHGRFEGEIKAARGPGLITGFFLHRAFPRQEIDIEITGDDTRCMMVNVYFNPGDDGTAMEYGYRGSPCRIDLGFDAASDFHHYVIDWRPERITWLVDGRTVHGRVGWDPTPIPHLPMKLHGNLWTPRSRELAGRIDEDLLPASAIFRNVSIWT